MQVQALHITASGDPWHLVEFTSNEQAHFMMSHGTFFRPQMGHWHSFDIYNSRMVKPLVAEWLFENVGEDRFTYWNIDRPQWASDISLLPALNADSFPPESAIPATRRNWFCSLNFHGIAFRHASSAVQFKLALL